MPVVTITDKKKKMRKTIFARNLEELKLKGCKKLNLENSVMKVSHAETGGEVDDDDVLNQLNIHDVLVLLQEDEEFDNSNEKKALESPSDCFSSEQSMELEEGLGSHTVSHMSSTTTGNTSFGKEIQSGQVAATTKNTPGFTAKQQVVITASTPLPAFSPKVQTYLVQNQSHAVWRQMIQEAADYYHQIDNSIGKENQHVYTLIGKKMMSAYPDIKRTGNKDWSVFTSDLSAKVRAIRYNEKRKSLPKVDTPNSCTAAIKVAKFSSSAAVVKPALSDDRFSELTETLRRAFTKFRAEPVGTSTSKELVGEICVGMKETYKNRRDMIQSMTASGSVKAVIQLFPFYQEPVFIYAEMKLIKPKLWSQATAIDKLNKLFDAAVQLMPEKKRKQGVLGDIAAFQYMEEQSGYGSGKGGKSKSLLHHKTDLTEAQLDRNREAKWNEPNPKLVVCTDGDELSDAFIVADDGMKILCASMSFRQALFVLLCTYYVAWISYPREMSQMLGLLQQFVLGEVYGLDKGRRWKEFVHKLDKLM